MNKKEFFKGMGMGVVAGAAIAMACAPACTGKKPGSKSGVGRVVKTIGGVMEDIADAVGL